MAERGELWRVIERTLDSTEWTSLQTLYGAVEAAALLNEHDCVPARPGSRSPRWKRNVRNVLQSRRASGDVLWDGRGSYMLRSPRSRS